MEAVTDPDQYEPVVPLTDDVAGDTAVVARRALQFALDVALVQVIAVTVAVLVTLACRLVLGPGQLLLLVVVAGLVWLWLSLVGWLLVTVLWPVLHGGRTPAMRWCGLRVVTATGAPPRPAAHVLRCALTVVDGFAFGLVGLVIMTNARRQRRLGDIVAGALVVRDRSRS
ncbi:MAG TPA: RDD family protein [Pseudonocardiaceae bacterium]